MTRGLICRIFGHKMKLFLRGEYFGKKSEVYVCKRCDKVSGKLAHIIDIDFDKQDKK